MSTGKKVVVIGTGYVGLPAALMLAKAGYQVLGVDLQPRVVDAINNRELLFEEDDMQQLMRDPVVDANLRASLSVEPGDVFIIAVPTPVHPKKKVSDLAFVDSAVASVLPVLQKGNLIIIESTIPPRTCRDRVAAQIEGATGLRVPEDVLLSHCPERVLPGDIFREIVNNDRIIGGVDAASAEASRELYASFVKGSLFLTDDVTAELCKLMENAYRDVNIALANEMAAVCEGLGIEPKGAFELANKHPRVNYLMPGIGVGGHCIAVDPWFIREVDPENTTLIATSRGINDRRPAWAASKLRKMVADVADPLIVCVGASYKPNVADTRESPANDVVERLCEDGYRVKHIDPMVPGMDYSSLAEACRGADLLAVLVPHRLVVDDLDANESEILAALRHPRIVRF